MSSWLDRVAQLAAGERSPVEWIDHDAGCLRTAHETSEAKYGDIVFVVARCLECDQAAIGEPRREGETT